MLSGVLQARRPLPILLNIFFSIAVWLVDNEYEVSKVFSNVYLPRQADFVVHFLKICMFLPLEGDMDKLC